VGPSESSWRLFKQKYEWCEPLIQLVQAKMAEGMCNDTEGGDSDSGDDALPRLPPELWDMHILKQQAGAAMGGAVFSDHQDRHAESQHKKVFDWTVTLLVDSTGSPTGFYMWGGNQQPYGATSAADGGDGITTGRSAGGVISYDTAGVGVMFPSLAWHRTVIPAEEHWPFNAIKFSFFFTAASERSRRLQGRSN